MRGEIVEGSDFNKEFEIEFQAKALDVLLTVVNPGGAAAYFNELEMLSKKRTAIETSNKKNIYELNDVNRKISSSRDYLLKKIYANYILNTYLNTLKEAELVNDSVNIKLNMVLLYELYDLLQDKLLRLEKEKSNIQRKIDSFNPGVSTENYQEITTKRDLIMKNQKIIEYLLTIIEKKVGRGYIAKIGKDIEKIDACEHKKYCLV